MLFIALMSLSTTAVASIAAFFSVYGLAHTFTGAFWSVVAMGSSLEAGKLMLASFVYRFKDVIGWRIKMPAYAFIMVLMLITSTGIYGYLSAAYQADSAGSQQVSASLTLKKQEQATLQQRKTQIDQQIAQLPSNNVRGRQQLMRQFAPEEKQIDADNAKVTQEIQDLSQQQITSDAHIGPIMYIAKVLGMQPDSAIAILMCLIIFVFDPLAMLLTISTNVAIEKYQQDKKKLKEEQQARNDKDEDVFRGKGWEPKKSYFDSELVAMALEKEPTSYSATEYVNPKTLMVESPPLTEVNNWTAVFEQPKSVLPKLDPDVNPNETNWYETYEPPYDTQEVIERQVEEQAAEETSVDPSPWNWPKSDYKVIDTPVVPEEVVEPLNEVIVYEMGEAKPLDEEPVYEMQQEVSPIHEIKQIEQEIDQKPKLSEEEQEMKDMIKRFFARQDLIRSTRRD